MEVQLLTARQVAKLLNLRPVTVYAAAAAGKIPHVELWSGRRRRLIRFRPTDIESLIADRTRPARPAEASRQ